MECILKMDNESVVIYVSPSKALVNQIEAEIYARFSKEYKNKNVLCGTYTRDFEHDTFQCQILITIPQCLEQLFLTTATYSWIKKIKYIILDEIHQISGNDGEVWEHILTLCNAPGNY